MAMEIRRTISGPNDTSAHDAPILCGRVQPGAARDLHRDAGHDDLALRDGRARARCRSTRARPPPPELRVLFSCSIDGRILVWSKGELQKEKVGPGKGGMEEQGSVKGGLPSRGTRGGTARRRRQWPHLGLFGDSETEMMPGVKIVIRFQSLLKDAHAAMGPENALVRGIMTTNAGKIFSVGYDRRLCGDTDSTRMIGGSKPKAEKGGVEDSGVPKDPPKLKMMGDGPIECHDGAISALRLIRITTG